MSDAERIGRVERVLREAFAPEKLEVVDESHRHRGHAGAAAGGSHLRVAIVSPQFEGRSHLDRHRMVYESLGALMGSEIHALALEALAPSETRS